MSKQRECILHEEIFHFPFFFATNFTQMVITNVSKVGTGCKEAGEKIMLVTFLVIYNIYSWGRWRFFLS
jgi:hypothetical protein